jgi:DNA-binding winged helix-turn-helix (wHTH) protein
MRSRLARFGLFEVDLDSGEVRRKGMRVRLAGKPFDLLALLLERPGETITREEIRCRLWPDGTFVDFEHGLNSAVARLRQTLGDSARSPRFIETIPRKGYRWIATASTPAPESSPAHHRWLVATAIVFIFTVLPTVHSKTPSSREYVIRAAERLTRDWDWRAAELDVQRAIELGPDSARPRQTYAYLLAGQGRILEANVQIQRAQQLDPISPEVRRDAAVILYLSRRYAAAIEALTPLVIANPNDADATRVLADAFLQAGDEERAAVHYTRWLELVDVPAAEVQRVRDLLRRDGFAGLWTDICGRPSGKKGHGYKTATMLASLGRRTEAFAALDRAFEDRDRQLLFIRIDPYLDPLRDDPRFESLLSRHGL